MASRRSTRLNLRFVQCVLLLIAFAFAQKTANAQNWTQLGSDIDGEAAGDESGSSVSLSADGSTLAIGAMKNSGNGFRSGHVRAYKLLSGEWTQLGSDIDGEAAEDNSGVSVSLSADGITLAIGAVYNDGNGVFAGHVRVYQWNGIDWTQLGSDIDGEAAGNYSGRSVSLSADGITLAVGAVGISGNGQLAGHVRVYQWNGMDWTQLGSDIDGEAAGDESGSSVSLSADGITLAIGAIYNDGNGTESGHVRVYKLLSGEWTQLGSDIDGEAAEDISGRAVSLSADGITLAVGAGGNTGNGQFAGHVRVYQWNGLDWTQLGSDIDGEAAGDGSGWSVGLSADGITLAVGAGGNDGNGTESGHVRVYKLMFGAWTQLGSDIDGEAAEDISGWSVSLSADGSTLAIGAKGNDGNGTDSGHVRVYQDSTVVDIMENDFGPNFTVYPNPTSGLITISLDQHYSGLNLDVRDAGGKQVATYNFSTAAQTTFELEGASGIYFFDVTSAGGRSARLRVVKK